MVLRVLRMAVLLMAVATVWALADQPAHADTAGHLKGEAANVFARAGAIIIPEAPGFYNRPKDLEALVDGLVGRVLKEIGIENNLEKEWGTQ